MIKSVSNIIKLSYQFEITNEQGVYFIEVITAEMTEKLKVIKY